MAKSAMRTYVTISNSGPSRLANAWRVGPKSLIGNMRDYARKHGAAGWLKADGTYLLIYLKDGKLRQKTMHNVAMR